MVAAGEAGGILDTILQRLSVYIEKIVKLRAAVRSALVYPVAVILIAVGVVWIILWKVIPTFATLFEGLRPAHSPPASPSPCRSSSAAGGG